jgi:hypothetical protein
VVPHADRMSLILRHARIGNDSHFQHAIWMIEGGLIVKNTPDSDDAYSFITLVRTN